MKLRLGHLVTDIRGSTGGLTFKRGPYGSVAYAKPHPRRTRSDNQRDSSRHFAFLLDRWRNTLTAAQRDGWRNFAQAAFLSQTTKRDMYLTAITAYVQTNVLRRYHAIPVLDDAPALAQIKPPLGIVIEFFNTNNLFVRFTQAPIAAGEWLIVNVSRPFSGAVSNPRTWTKQTKLFTGPIAATQLMALTPPRYPGAHVAIDDIYIDNESRFSFPDRRILLWI